TSITAVPTMATADTMISHFLVRSLDRNNGYQLK
ncbi:unnamed protein product, partial [marine sediment metagenome]